MAIHYQWLFRVDRPAGWRSLQHRSDGYLLYHGEMGFPVLPVPEKDIFAGVINKRVIARYEAIGPTHPSPEGRA
jgi:hypothetical protein